MAKPNEKQYLFHMCSRSLNDSKVWMMTKYQSNQNKTPNPHGMHRLDCCKYHHSAMKSLTGLTAAPRAAETGPFILSNNLLRNFSPGINAKLLGLVWGFFLAVQVFERKCFDSSCILSHLAETTKV